MPFLLTALVLTFNDGRAQEQAESNALLVQSIRGWPERHPWTIAGMSLSAVSTAFLFSSVMVLGAVPGPLLPGPTVQQSDARLGWSLFGFGVTALIAAVGMVIYNAGL